MKRRALRPPFLITVATLAGSMAAGCGGAVSGGENAGSAGDMGQGGTHGGATSSGGNGVTTTGGNGVTTTSGNGGNGVTTTSSTTSGTTVTVGTGGSGPGGTGGAGGTTAGDCPAGQPGNGSSCASPGQVCNYPYCGFAAGTSFECMAGRWAMRPTPSCNPPPPPLPCPAAEPTAGSYCSGFQYQSKTCSYPVTCCGLPWRQANYECPLATNQWRRIEASDVGADAGGCFMPSPSCPSTIPADGSSCCFSAPSKIDCFYGCTVASGQSWIASCDGSRWHVGTIAGSCNPPGREGGVVLPEGGWGEGGPHYWDRGGPE